MPVVVTPQAPSGTKVQLTERPGNSVSGLITLRVLLRLKLAQEAKRAGKFQVIQPHLLG